jgi:hypothetical protein
VSFLGGHGHFQCPSLLQYGSPLGKDNGILGAEVATYLMKSTSYLTTNIAPNDEHITRGFDGKEIGNKKGIKGQSQGGQES